MIMQQEIELLETNNSLLRTKVTAAGVRTNVPQFEVKIK
jgi:hypothetical protein